MIKENATLRASRIMRGCRQIVVDNLTANVKLSARWQQAFYRHWFLEFAGSAGRAGRKRISRDLLQDCIGIIC